MNKEDLNSVEISKITNKKSGLLGLSRKYWDFKGIEDNLKGILALKDRYPSDFDILNTIEGYVLARFVTSFIVCVGEVNRFSSVEKLISYIGLYPNLYEFENTKRRILSNCKS